MNDTYLKIVLGIIVLKMAYSGLNTVIDNNASAPLDWPPAEAYDSTLENRYTEE